MAALDCFQRANSCVRQTPRAMPKGNILMTGLILLSVLGVGVLLSSLAPEIEDFLPEESADSEEPLSTVEAENLLDQFEADDTISLIRGESGVTQSAPDELLGTEAEEVLVTTQAVEQVAPTPDEELAELPIEFADPTAQTDTLAEDEMADAEMADAEMGEDEPVLDEVMDELLMGTSQDDEMGSDGGEDTLQGAAGDDLLVAIDTGLDGDEMAADTLIGGEGDDTLMGDKADVMTGGEGADIIKVLGLEDKLPDEKAPEEKVTVTDFDPEEDVLILVDKNGDDLLLADTEEDSAEETAFIGIRPTEDGGSTEIIYDDTVVAVLLGTDVETLEENAAWLANRNAMALVAFARLSA